MPSSLHLTPVHFSVYNFIVAFKQNHDGVSPTVQEIQEACQIPSTSQVRPVLNSLVLLGMIEVNYSRGKSRMISIPGARWVPPLNSDFSSPLKQAEHVESVRGSSIKS